MLNLGIYKLVAREIKKIPMGGRLLQKKAFFKHFFNFRRLFTTFFCFQTLYILVIIVIIKVSKS